ncbi:MAG: helicase-exonuclease AddAB subunit AddA [Oscillospiraceae bacterium]|nr:helicase-exonuclease AddAB subunit AddA [Oscillospiraceae bacterium]
MGLKFTKQQETAISEKGNILVCAAAGSGKTAVLVERVIRMLTREQNPISADRLLIVTFTNAAAAEMRSRIEKRIYEETLKRPNDAALKKQRFLIASAKICTIDSFCIDLVRENFEKLSVTPDFKIITDTNLNELSRGVLSSVIEEQLDNADDVLYKLLELTGCEYDESNLAKAVKNVFDYSMQMPFPDVFLKNLAVNYEIPFGKGNPFFDRCIEDARRIIGKLSEYIENGFGASEMMGDSGQKFKDYFAMLYNGLLPLKKAVEAEDWDEILLASDSFLFPTAPRTTKNMEPSLASEVKKCKNGADFERKKLKRIFFEEKDQISSELVLFAKPINRFIDIIKEYRERLFQAQLEENTLTFYNTEQLALKLLCEEKDGMPHIRPEAYEFLNQFDEVLVDEYQDVNDLQDALFYVLSNCEQKLFAVGDLKQSIYGFRGANPNNFLKKKDRYIPVEEASENDARKIILANNFRSRGGVCDFVNFFFSLFMTEETGKIIYNSEEELVATAEFAENDIPKAKLCLIDKIGESDEERLVVEADAIANNIVNIINSGECIHTKEDGLRKATYSDFAILLRSTSTSAGKIAARLEERGIPVNYPKDNFLNLLEVDTFLSLLKIIDNPLDNIAMLTVMMSPIFSFTAEELASIKAKNPNTDLISAIAAEKDNNEHLREFYSALENFRTKSLIMPLAAFVHKLIIDTGYGDIVLAMPDGVRRRANLFKLADFAAAYSQNSAKGIGGFIEYMKTSVGEREASVKINSGNAVQIMSIHASKGLQFPVCIIANLESQTNMSDSNDAVIFSENYGIGFKYYDEMLGTKKETLARVLISNEMRAKTLEEELRLLYVAMTRAEDMLVMMAAYNNLPKKLLELASALVNNDLKVTNDMFMSASSVGNWILTAALLHKSGEALRTLAEASFVPFDTASDLSVEIVSADGIKPIITLENTDTDIDVNPQIVSKIKENINYSYPFDVLKNIEAKASVSAIANKAESERFAFSSIPSFMASSGITAAGRGTAMHKVMQFISFSSDVSVEDEIERLREWEYISETEAEAVDISAIKAFFKSDVFARIKNADNIKREMRFLTEVSAGKIDSTIAIELQDEKIIIQGAVDLCFEENGEIVILDFKSDRVESFEELKNTYSEQLNIYAEACKKIFNKPVREKLIYSFALNCFGNV